MKRQYPNETSAACKSQIPETKLQKNTKLQISVKNLWQSRRQEIVNGSNLNDTKTNQGMKNGIGFLWKSEAEE